MVILIFYSAVCYKVLTINCLPVQSVYPELNELSTRSPDGFQPHLTLGQYSTRGRENLLENVKKGWKNIEFEVSRGWGMIRGCVFLIIMI